MRVCTIRLQRASPSLPKLHTIDPKYILSSALAMFSRILSCRMYPSFAHLFPSPIQPRAYQSVAFLRLVSSIQSLSTSFQPSFHFATRPSNHSQPRPTPTHSRNSLSLPPPPTHATPFTSFHQRRNVLNTTPPRLRLQLAHREQQWLVIVHLRSSRSSSRR